MQAIAAKYQNYLLEEFMSQGRTVSNYNFDVPTR
jgi:hypothetical protein